MNELDQQSQDFINQTLKRLANENFFYDLVKQIAHEFEEFCLLADKKELLEMFKQKMITGAKEHGAPKTSISKIQTEIDMEFMDLVCWTMMRKNLYEE